jgi:hypothetical protein
MRKTFVVSLMILLGLSGSAAQAANTNMFEPGLQSYANGQYQSAFDQFHQLAQTDIKNAEAHYLLAITMVRVNNPQDARKEYQRTISLDPRGVYGQQAQLGLSALGGKTQGASSTAAVLDAVTAIRQQAQVATQIKDGDAQANVNDIHETTSGQVSRIAKRRNDVASDMASATIVLRDGDVCPAYSPAQIQSVEDHYNDRIVGVQDAGDEQAAQAMANGVQTVAALRDSVNNLYGQLASSNSKGVKLIPQGTNLYVRNYSSN